MTHTTLQPGSAVLTDTLTVAEFAVMLKLHPVTIKLKAAAGGIPGTQLGNSYSAPSSAHTLHARHS